MSGWVSELLNMFTWQTVYDYDVFYKQHSLVNDIVPIHLMADRCLDAIHLVSASSTFVCMDG